MISSAEALEIILAQQLQLGSEQVAIVDAYGRVLTENVVADRDFPPFHRVTMDGVAINSRGWHKGKQFMVQGVQAAGDPPLVLSSDDSAIEIMTGAVLPAQADAVIKVEECQFIDTDNGRMVLLETNDVVPFKNVHKKGLDRIEGDVLLPAGTRIASPEIGVLATVGLAMANVQARPKIAIISTGDELVEIEEVPKDHQIRRSNVFSIQADLYSMGYVADQFHLIDDKAELLEKISDILSDYPVLILSGGVSKGKFDFLPEVLKELGINKLFHRIAQRPGKPFWFGRSASNIVFALPGNPVSTYMCFVVYAKPWLLGTEGIPQAEMTAVLVEDFAFQPALTYFLQVSVSIKDGKLLAQPVQGHGSGDHANLAYSNGFLELPKERSEFHKGEIYKLHLFRRLD